MYTKVNGEQQVQILSPNFSISPSNEDYVLNISANGRDFSPLFAVSAGVTRLVSNVAPGSYYKLVGNQSQVVINWQRMCATEGGSFDPSVLDPYWTSAETVNYVDSAISGISLDGYWTSAETQSAITEVDDHLYDVERVTASALTVLHDSILELSGSSVDLSAYTPTSGFATINGSAITNGGDIVIQGGADMSAYYTSAQTEDAISAATSGKADAVSVTPYSDRCLFPKWNSQGIITGVYKEATNRSVKVNGSTFRFYSSEGFDLPDIYSPANAGTAGEILVSTGGRPVWSAVTFPDVSNYVTSAQVETQIVEKNYITSAATANMVSSTYISNIWKGTQSDYDAITTKDPSTFYIIVSN